MEEKLLIGARKELEKAQDKLCDGIWIMESFGLDSMKTYLRRISGDIQIADMKMKVYLKKE